MKADMDKDNQLVISPDSEYERDALEKWYSDNPVSEDDGINMRINCER